MPRRLNEDDYAILGQMIPGRVIIHEMPAMRYVLYDLLAEQTVCPVSDSRVGSFRRRKLIERVPDVGEEIYMLTEEVMALIQRRSAP